MNEGELLQNNVGQEQQRKLHAKRNGDDRVDLQASAYPCQRPEDAGEGVRGSRCESWGVVAMKRISSWGIYLSDNR